MDIKSTPTAPTVGVGGMIYIGSLDGNVLALSPTGELRWIFRTESSLSAPPVTSVDGMIYVGSWDYNMYAITPAGNLKWSYKSEGKITMSAVIGSDGTVYFGADDLRVYAISSEGELRWTYEAGKEFMASPVIGTDGRIYVGAGIPYVLNSDGHLVYEFSSEGYLSVSEKSLYLAAHASRHLYSFTETSVVPASSTAPPTVSPAMQPTVSARVDKDQYEEKWVLRGSSPFYSAHAIGSDGTIYAVADDGSVCAIDPNGAELWRTNTNSREVFNYPVVVANNEYLYFTSESNYLYALSLTGELLWTYYMNEYTSRRVSVYWTDVLPPAVGSDGTIYVVGESTYSPRKLLAITQTGMLKWSLDVGLSYYPQPYVDTDGKIYIGSCNSLFVISSSGQVLWTYTTGGCVGAPVVGTDGTIYVGSFVYTLYAIDSTGILKWTYLASGQITASPAIGLDGTVYFKAYDANVYALSPEGKLKWTYATDKSAESYWGKPVIGPDGRIYVGSDSLYVLALDGTLIWYFHQTYGVHVALSGGVVYLSCWDDGLLRVFVKNKVNKVLRL
eukprot:gene977-biopygen1049